MLIDPASTNPSYPRAPETTRLLLLEYLTFVSSEFKESSSPRTPNPARTSHGAGVSSAVETSELCLTSSAATGAADVCAAGSGAAGSGAAGSGAAGSAAALALGAWIEKNASRL